MTTERVKMETTHEKFTFSTFIKTTFSSKAMIGIILAALMLLLAQLTQNSMTNYVYPNYFQNASAISISGMLGVAVMLGISPFIGKLANKFGRKEVAIFGSLFGAAAMIACYFMAKSAESRGDVAKSTMGNEMLQKLMAKMSLQDLLKQAGEKAVPKEAVKQLNAMLQKIAK